MTSQGAKLTRPLRESAACLDPRNRCFALRYKTNPLATENMHNNQPLMTSCVPLLRLPPGVEGGSQLRVKLRSSIPAMLSSKTVSLGSKSETTRSEGGFTPMRERSALKSLRVTRTLEPPNASLSYRRTLCPIPQVRQLRFIPMSRPDGDPYASTVTIAAVRCNTQSDCTMLYVLTRWSTGQTSNMTSKVQLTTGDTAERDSRRADRDTYSSLSPTATALYVSITNTLASLAAAAALVLA